MKKHYLAAILVMMIGISSAVSDHQQRQTGFSFTDLNLNPGVVSSAEKVTVKIKDNSFQPSALTIVAGTKVEWHNQDSIQYTVESDNQGLFDSGVIMPGRKYTLSFNTPGSYGYHCSIHRAMRGTINVISASPAAAPSQTGSSPSWSEQPLTQSDLASPSELQPLSSSNSLQLQPINPAITTGLLQASPQSSSRSTAQTSSEASSQTALQRYSSYYRMQESEPVSQITSPTQVELTDFQPQMLYFGSSQKAVPYSQYQSYTLSTGSNSLWISGATSWTQYAEVPLGSYLNMIAASPSGGYGYLYEVYPDGSLDKNAYSFYTYNLFGFYANSLGEHQLFFNIAGQPSNIIVINVVPDTQTPPYNFAAITIRSTWLRGYNLYVDGSYRATEGMTGEPDGVLTINVPGDQYHNIAIDGSGVTFSENKYFRAGYAYQLNI